jgi:hypothetical protein
VATLVGGYTWQRQREAAYRQHTTEQLTVLAEAVIALRSKRHAFVEKYSPSLIENPQSPDANAEGTQPDNEQRKLRVVFYALEDSIKNRGDGPIPKWVKDHRTWQELDRYFKQTH